MPRQRPEPGAVEQGQNGALEEAPAGFLSFSAEGVILRVNGMLCTMLGYTAAELTGQPMSRILTTASRVFCQTHFFPILQLQGEVDEIHLSLRTKAGGALPVLVNARHRIPEGAPDYNDCVLVRMSLRSRYEDEILRAKKEADEANAAKERALAVQHMVEEQLRTQAVRLQLATQLAGLAVCDVDFTKDMIHLPAVGAAFFGLGEAPRAVPRSEIHALFHPQYSAAVEQDITAAMDPNGPGTLAIEHPIILPSGEVRWLNAHMQVRFNDVGDGPVADHGVLVIRDITDQKKLEQDLLSANRHKDEFLATLAHELRNPLAPLMTGLQLMEEELRDPGVKGVHDMMQRQVDQLMRLVNDMLDVNRINQGKVELRIADLDLKDVLSTALETVQPLIVQREHTMATTLPKGSWKIRGDAQRLAQVFTNLLSNAAKYTPPQGHITLTLTLDGSDALIAVQDNGVGMAPEDLPRIFELFAQVKVVGRNTAGGGLGIGLNIVKRLVELHGGTVTVSSEGADKGCLFAVRLPLMSA